MYNPLNTIPPLNWFFLVGSAVEENLLGRYDVVGNVVTPQGDALPWIQTSPGHYNLPSTPEWRQVVTDLALTEPVEIATMTVNKGSKMFKGPNGIAVFSALQDVDAAKRVTASLGNPVSTNWLKIPVTSGLFDFSVNRGNPVWYYDDVINESLRPAVSINGQTVWLCLDNVSTPNQDVRSNNTRDRYVGDLSDFSQLRYWLLLPNCANATGSLSDVSGLLRRFSIRSSNITGNVSVLGHLTYICELLGCTQVTGDISVFSNLIGNLRLEGCTNLSGVLMPHPSLRYIYLDNTGMSISDVDQTVINLNNTTTRNNGALRLNGLTRSHASDAAIAALKAKGWTVQDALVPVPLVFTSTQDGNFNDGATWGLSSPGVAGVDYPSTSHSFVIGHKVTVPTGTTLSAYGRINNELIVNGTFDVQADIAMAQGSKISGTSGTVNLNNHNISGTTYYRNWTLDFNGTASNKSRINGPGRLGYNGQFNVYQLPAYQFNHTIIDGLTGLNSFGNQGSETTSITNSEISNIDGPFVFIESVSRVDDSVGFIVDNTDFENINSAGALRFGSTDNTAGTVTIPRRITGCTFNNCGGVHVTNGFSLTGTVLNETPIQIFGVKSDINISRLFSSTATDQNQISKGHYNIDNCYVYADVQNSHLFTYGNFLAISTPFQLTNNVLEMPNAVEDGYDILVLPQTNVPVIAHHNLIIGEGDGVFINALGAAIPGNVNVYNNTIYNKGTIYGSLARNETAGIYTGAEVSFKNNLVVSNFTDPAARAINLGVNNTADQITFVDNNAFYGFTSPNRYYDVTMTGKTLGSAGFGGSDLLDIDPGFVDSNRKLSTWDASLGGPGTAVHAIAELLKLNKPGYNSAYNIDALLIYVKAGFATTNTVLATGSDTGGQIGAI